MVINDRMFSPIKLPQLHAEVQAQIRSLIDRGVLRPGQALPSERELSSQLGVSRNSLREALRVLEALGIVVTKHGVGRTIRESGRAGVSRDQVTDTLEMATILEIYEIREVLEAKAIEWACERATDAELENISLASETGGPWSDTIHFHRAISAAAHNYMFEQILFEQMNLLDALRQRERYSSPEDAESLIAEHRFIAEALSARDEKLAVRLMVEHLRQSRVRMRSAEFPSNATNAYREI